MTPPEQRVAEGAGPSARAPVLELTEDLLLRVFSKLPTTSLARCEAVCRVWRRTLRGTNAARSVWSDIHAEGLFQRRKLKGRPTLDALLADLTTRAVTLESTWDLHGVGFAAEAAHHLRSVDLTGCTGLSMASVLLLVTRPRLASVDLRDTFQLSELDLMVLLSHCGVAFDSEVQGILQRGLQNMALWLHPRLRLGTAGNRRDAEASYASMPPYRLDAALVFTSCPNSLTFSKTTCQVRGSFTEWAQYMLHPSNAAYGYTGAASIASPTDSGTGHARGALVLSGLDLSLSKPWLRSVIGPLSVFLAGGTLQEVLDKGSREGTPPTIRGPSHRFVNVRLDACKIDLRDAKLTDDDANALFKHCQLAELLDDARETVAAEEDEGGAEGAMDRDGGGASNPTLAQVRLRSPNTTLQVLNLSDNPALQWPQNLFEAVSFFHGLRELNLSGCSSLGPYCGAALGASLAGGSCGTLEVLDVSAVGLGAVGVKGLCMGLRWHVGLRTLRMNDNHFGDEGAELIASALMFILSAAVTGDEDGSAARHRGAVYMDDLCLAGNAIGDRGAERLSAMLCAVCSQAGEVGMEEAEAEAVWRHAHASQSVVVENLDLSRNALTGTGCASLSVAMIRRPNFLHGAVSSLVLDDNVLVGTRGAGLFATSIMARGNAASPLRHLSVARCGIEAAGASYLSSCLRACGGTLAHLDLSENSVGDAGAIALGCALGETVGRRLPEWTGEVASVADELVLRNMGMTGLGIVAMCESLDCNLGAGNSGGLSLAVKGLDLCGNVIGSDGVIALATLMKRGRLTLEALGLSGSRCGDLGATAIATVLGHPSCVLQDLDMGSNSMSATGLAILAKDLVRNTSLRRLDLSHNDFGDEGAFILARALLPDPDAINLELDKGLCLDDVVGKHVGSIIAPAGVLREINLRSCCLSHAGIGQLKSAVELRESVLGDKHAIRLVF